MEWTDIVHAVQFNVEKEPSGQGAFRAAFKATSCNANFKDKVWVFKKYSNPEDDIELIGDSVESHAKKASADALFSTKISRWHDETPSFC